MANVAKKVSWSGRDPRDDDDEDGNGDGPAGESTPLLNGTGHGARQVGPGGAPGGSPGLCGRGPGPGPEPSGGCQHRGEPRPGPEVPGLGLRVGRSHPHPPPPGYRELGSPGGVPGVSPPVWTPQCEPPGVRAAAGGGPGASPQPLARAGGSCAALLLGSPEQWAH